MNKETTSILLVEDDESLGFLLKDNLAKYGWKTHLYSDGEKGLTAFNNHDFDLCILDVMLPQKDGFTLAREIRKLNQRVPIIFLTAKGMTEDKIRGFQSGADDYVTKPFSIDEFRYRIEAILKRINSPDNYSKEQTLTFNQSTLDLKNLLLKTNRTTFQLTHKECELLKIFFRHPNQLVERKTILRAVWEDDGFFVARSMDVFISRLRKYLKPDPSIRIENIRGIGYIMKG